jgi:hypothetical protein
MPNLRIRGDDFMPTTSDPEATLTLAFESSVAVVDTLVEDRRNGERLRRTLPLKLSGLGWTKCQACVAEDIGEGGLYLRLPAAAGLTVGQRCELLVPEKLAPQQLSNLAGETVYATVVRTELLAEGAKQLVGAGLRFDRPLFL